MILHPPAKVNLGLLIKGKRADGYHLLETLLLPVPSLHDTLQLFPHGSDGECRLLLEGQPLDGEPEENLVVKAYRALSRQVSHLPGVEIRLEKKIPAGAGLGGGSSDAAWTLRGLKELFELPIDAEELHRIAATLGADVPFFLYDGPMLATGTGTDLSPFQLKMPWRLEVLHPPIHSSTVAAYRALDHRAFDPKRSLQDLLRLPISQWRERLPNDLEVPVFGLYPDIADYKQQLYDRGALYAAMSGSGSACFGLFES